MGMIAKILYYQEEIQAMPAKPAVSVDKAELKMAKTLIASMTRPFDPAAYHDEYQARLRAAIESKINGEEIVSADNAQSGNVIDFMTALKKTVEQVEQGVS